jgi:hypothetical protein
MMNKDMVKGVTLPLTEMTTDELFSLLIGNKMVDVANMKSFDPNGFREMVKKDMNQHLGGEYIARCCWNSSITSPRKRSLPMPPASRRKPASL